MYTRWRPSVSNVQAWMEPISFSQPGFCIYLHNNLGQQMQHSPQILSGLLNDDASRKSESPSRKRRKTSGGVIDLTDSPSPPAWDAIVDSARPIRRRSSTQRRVPGERCNTPRARRSPGTRRQTRERNTLREAESPERRAFQPPNLIGRQVHPAALHPGQQAHQPVMLEVDQVHVSAPVTMTPYGIPVCTGPHQIPACDIAHMPVCSTQSTWSIPACTMQLPGCSMQHIPACSLQQMPIAHTMPPLLHHPHHPPQHHQLPHQHHNVAAPTHFSRVHRPPIHEDEVHLMAEHQSPFGLHPGIQHRAPLNPSPPVLLQEPAIHPSPHDLYMQGPYQRYYARRSTGRNRLRNSLPLPSPPPYPGFLLHFLAMLGNPPVPPYGRDAVDEASEVENYEALLNLAERLGEAKPRGLTKADIKQLPAYCFNSEMRRSDLDQTSCVVCMCDFENRQLLRVLPCSHEFHAKCVDKWLKTNRTCPVCRADATDLLMPPPSE
ncbi:E3 ubiquitin-protein ligase RNF38-like isoform X2 [Gigantopelta aegis]|uniref:E3 ubiquitin-protein ligase RNF38-like isoform X2 n=1 Tax=Gigantopelta aegis TaxID=1735272 RepID=UPI001B889474|nr:E3 ubiquitin-protein ligase RNF38-like isoform X2 [Gigantopelta aegis]